MHWLVPAAKAKSTKIALENLGHKPKLKAIDNSVHIFVPDLTDSHSIPGASFEPCEICPATPSPQLSPATKAPGNGRYRYAIYPPLILFSNDIDPQTATVILARENCTHAAINKPIPNLDIVRRPHIQPLVGDFGEFNPEGDFDTAFWCTCRQNGIFQTWAPLYTMFSRGNITEKKRVLEFKGIKDTTVIDLYCGIGYFTFSYAANSPKVVYGWEINPWSIEGLVRAAKANKWNVRVIPPDQIYEAHPHDRLVIFAEDNARAINRMPQLDLSNISHINMGLLPDCRQAWRVAKHLATEKTMFHVHENVHENDLEQWRHTTSAEMGTLVHLEKIKQFSPGVWHVCGDFENR